MFNKSIILNQNGHIQTIGNKNFSLITRIPTLYHIGDVFNNTFWDTHYDSIIKTYEKMQYPSH